MLLRYPYACIHTHTHTHTHTHMCLMAQAEKDQQVLYKTGAFTAMAALDALRPISMDLGLHALGGHPSTVQLLMHNPGASCLKHIQCCHQVL